MSALLPLAYYEEFLKRLIRRGDVLFITYRDLSWGEDVDYEHGYPVEWKSWQKSVATGPDNDKVHILIQHDTDSGPDETVRMAKIERELGVRSNIMTFARWRGTQEAGQLEQYPIDWDALRDLQESGFCIGYHCNAGQNAGFDAARVCELFSSDVDFLSDRFSIDFFSPHGGRRGPQGETNAAINYPEVCTTNLRWVHNRFSPHFHQNYSDGGLTGRLRKGTTRDLRDWVGSLRKGRRYRALIHSQYYDNSRFVPASLKNVSSAWYDELRDRITKTDIKRGCRQFWRDHTNDAIERDSDHALKSE